jgi:hypothetical protein
MNYELLHRIGEKRSKNPELAEEYGLIQKEIWYYEAEIKKPEIKFNEELRKFFRAKITGLYFELCKTGLCDCIDCQKKYVKRGYI